MGRKRKKKNRALPPRCKRMKRQGRLQSAVSWLKQFSGKNVLRGYCKHYGVDWRCGAAELQQLGVRIDPGYLKQRELTEQNQAAKRKEEREAQAAESASDCWYDYDSAFEAYLAEDYEALYDMECRENGDLWG
ncbi:MAG: hypothetical protein KDA60_04180 [Planctomycetales bacterium]|nr:hypothetical protein [Planctomycetales bacterium]